MRTHEKRHTAKPEHECADCGKAFLFKHQLVVHLRVHTGEKPYPCKHCGCAFATPSLRTKHTNSVCEKTEIEQLYTCHICNKSYRDKRVLRTHLKIHAGDKKFICEYCSKAFISFSDCNKHKRIHTGEKPYECTLCEKKFTFRYISIVKEFLMIRFGNDFLVIISLSAIVFEFTCGIMQEKNHFRVIFVIEALCAPAIEINT